MTSKIPACQSLAEAPTPAWDAVSEAYDLSVSYTHLIQHPAGNCKRKNIHDNNKIYIKIEYNA